MAPLLRILASRAGRLAVPRSPARALCTESKHVDSVVGIALDKTKYPPALINALSLENASRSERRRARKQHIIQQYQRSASDTGSSHVQIAVLTDRIKDLTEHVVKHRQDKHNRRRLVHLVNQRRSLMQYLLRKDPKGYMSLVTDLGLRPSSVFSKDTPLGAKKSQTPQLY